MNRDKCNNNRFLRNCGSRKTHKSGCEINTTQFTNVATGQNKFPTAELISSVPRQINTTQFTNVATGQNKFPTAELISSVPRQIAIPELPKGEQPKLATLPDNPLPYQNFIWKQQGNVQNVYL